MCLVPQSNQNWVNMSYFVQICLYVTANEAFCCSAQHYLPSWRENYPGKKYPVCPSVFPLVPKLLKEWSFLRQLRYTFHKY